MNTIEHVKEISVQISGKGDSKKQAVANALATIQKKVQKEDEIYVRMEPIHICVESAVEIKKKERFLFLFFPRIRTTFEVNLKVEIRVISVDIQKIEFVQKNVTEKLVQIAER